MGCDTLTSYTGRKLLFVGTESAAWGITDYHALGDFCALQKIDAVLLKVADGGNWWYGGLAGYHVRRDIIRSYNVSVIPYVYCYGDTYGALDVEIQTLITLLQDGGIVCADIEAEWEDKPAWAARVSAKLQPVAGVFLVSSWANPGEHSFNDVIRALDPCVNGYMPQCYSNYLSAVTIDQYAILTSKCLQPTVQLTQEYGANDPVASARAFNGVGYTTLSVWYEGPARENPALLQSVYTAFLGGQEMHNWYDTNPVIKTALDTLWDSTGALFSGSPPPRNTGIHSSWVSAHIDHGFQFGPPLTREYHTTDWNGFPLIAQQFAGARCEWDHNGHANWYTAQGKVAL